MLNVSLHWYHPYGRQLGFP